MDERQILEAALDKLMKDPSDGESERPTWPPTAERIGAARRRANVSFETIAARLGETPSCYWDLELYDNEVFHIIPVKQLASLARLLRMSVGELLFGDPAGIHGPRVPLDEVAKGLSTILRSEGISPNELGERIGWEVDEVFANPNSLSEYPVDAFREICKAAGVDWVQALPVEPAPGG